MSKPLRIFRNVAISLLALLVVLAIAAVLIVQSAWFRNYVQRTIITSVEDSTGGKAEIGGFQFDWTHMTAVVNDFVLHGTEAAGTQPLLRVARLQVNLRLLTSLHHWWDVTYLGIDRPQTNVIVFPDGRTNLPSPRTTSSSSDPLQTVVDLAIGHFELTNGSIVFAAQKRALNLRANNLLAQLSYNILSQQYRGTISLQPLYVISGRNTPVGITINVPIVLSRNRIEVNNASLLSPASSLTLTASLADLKNPKLSAHAAGHIAVADLKSAAGLTISNLPPTIDLDANVISANNGLHADIHRLSMGPTNLTGTADLDSQGAYNIHGRLDDLEVATALRAAKLSPLPYDAVLSGPIDLSGNVNAGSRGLVAHVKMNIRPAPRAIPVSGRLNAEYSGAKDDVSIQSSLLALPHSRLTLQGSLGKQLDLALTTTNLDDLFAALPRASRPEIALQGGRASFTGKVTGSLSSPKITGHLAANRLNVAGRGFDNFNADVSAARNGAEIQNGLLARNNMQAHFSGALGLRDWKAPPSSPLTIDASIQNGDLADLLALADQPSSGYSGQLSANAAIRGTLGNPRGQTSVNVTKGTIQGQPFDTAQAQINLTDQLVTVPSASVQLGPSCLKLTGQFQHPRDSFTTGQLRADIQSDPIDVTQLAEIKKQFPDLAGVVQIHASVAGHVSTQFELTSVNGNASARALKWRGQDYGDLTANAATTGQTVNYNLVSNFAGSNITADGSTQLTRDYPTTARADIAKLPIERILAVANRSDLPIKGMLSGTANFSGTAANPTGAADLTVSNGVLYDDAIDRVHARVNYQPASIDLPQIELTSGPTRLDLTAHYDHPAGDFESGNLQFRLDAAAPDLARIKTLARRRPGLAGSLAANASGKAEVRAADPRILLQDLNGNVKTTSLALNGKNLGDLALTANTAAGRTSFMLTSSTAGASIEGRGSVQLASGYPAEAQLTIKNLTWAGIRPLLGYSAAENKGFEASADADASLNGPLMNPEQLRASLQVSRLELSGAPSAFGLAASAKSNPLVLRNQGPIAMTLDRGALQIRSAHIAGPQTDLQASGSVPLNGADPMDVSLKGNVNLAILQQFDREITSAGNIVLAAGVRGSLGEPRLTGQLELHNASFDYPGLPTGLWKANGLIALNGNSAVIRNLTAEAGGGQISATGSATLDGTLRFSLQAKANRVRIMVEQGVGLVASATVNLAGTTDNSSVSGTVIVDQLSYNSRTDLGSLLSLAAPPVQAASTNAPLLDNMRLDIRVRSSSSLGVQSSLAQNLQLTADLRVRGYASHPAMLGRVQITDGKLVFFGSTYSVNTGTIGFYNPVRIEPVLDLSLETQTQGVDVVLKVTGALDNMKLSYTSDPPLPFQEIVSLLATGTTPTSDPTLLANQPVLPAQSFQQMGESAIVGRALADPVTNQLQRVFGVTQLKINPAFTSGSQLPEAQLSLQQQISNNVTFTYVTGLNTANAETIQVLWTFTPRWSAEALRDYNGIFSVTLTYKRQFR